MFVRENISFKRGSSPKRSLRIGSRVSVHKWFAEFAPVVEYEIDDRLNIRVEGNLYLENPNITSLPDNLSVGGSLFLENMNITSLPDNLSVERDLYLENTKINSLPDNLSVSGNIYKKF